MSQQRRTTRVAAGFTLIEIMLALGVLGVGMVMVGLIFPAAIHQTVQADRNTAAILICDNARTVLTAQVTHADAAAAANGMRFVVMPMGNCKDTPGSYLVYDSDAWYPVPRRADFEQLYSTYAPADQWPPQWQDSPNHLDAYKDNKYGWMALMRQTILGGDDYQFMVIPYRKFVGLDYFDGNIPWDNPTNWTPGRVWCDGMGRPPLVRIADASVLTTHLPAIEDVTITQDGNGCRLWFEVNDQADALQFIAVGSPVILDGDLIDPATGRPTDEAVLGRFPRIVGVDLDLPANSVVCLLSGNLFVLDDVPGDPLRERGIWLMPGVSRGSPCPAIGVSSFGVRLPR